jgi:hypothetical protein
MMTSALRIEWIGGVGYNTSVPSELQIDVCLAYLPLGETNPLGRRSRSSQTKRTVKIGVGLLSLLTAIGCASILHRVGMVALGEMTSSHSAIPRSDCLFGPAWPHVPRTPPGRHGAGP